MSSVRERRDPGTLRGSDFLAESSPPNLSLSPGRRRRRMAPIQSGQSHPLAGACLPNDRAALRLPWRDRDELPGAAPDGGEHLPDRRRHGIRPDRRRLPRRAGRRARADPPDGLQPLGLQDDHRDPRRRRSHPGARPGPRGPQVRGGRPPQERRRHREGGRDPHLRPDRRPGNPHPDAAAARSTGRSTRETS